MSKLIFFIPLRLFVLIFPFTLGAQPFTPTYDTTNYTYSGSFNGYLHNPITVIGVPEVNMAYKIIAEDFSSDVTWTTDSSINICDNYMCYTNLGQQLLNGTTYYATYPSTLVDMFDVSFKLPGANPGTHFVTIQLKDNDFWFDTTVTYMVHKWSTGVSVKSIDDKVMIYPNPARDEISVSLAKGIHALIISDVTGRKIAYHSVQQNPLKLDISGFNSGVYLLQIYNTEGHLVSTGRFLRE